MQWLSDSLKHNSPTVCGRELIKASKDEDLRVSFDFQKIV